MNNQTYQQQTTEIDLKELLWDMIEQWKAILLVSIILALIACGVKYNKDIKDYNETKKAKKETEEQMLIPAEERIASVYEPLSENDAASVRLVVKEKEWLKEQKQYIGESIFMNLDATNQITLKIVFDIDADNPENVPSIKNSLEAYIEGEDFASEIGNTIDPGTDSQYISELIIREEDDAILSQSIDSDSFLVCIILPDEKKAEEVNKVVNTSINNYSNSLNSSYPHSLSVAGMSISHSYDRVSVDKQRHTIGIIAEMQTTLKNAENALSDEQRLAVDAIMTIKEEVDDLKQETDNSKDSFTDTEILYTPTLNKRYAALGLVLGVFLYVIAYILIILQKGIISSASWAARYSKTRLLGEIYYDKEPSLFNRLMKSKVVKKYRYHGKNNKSKQIKRIIESIGAICAHVGANDITLLDISGIKSDIRRKEILQALSLEASKEDICTDWVFATEQINEKNLIGIDQAILIIDKETKLSVLNEMMSRCKEYEIAVLGSLFISEA